MKSGYHVTNSRKPRQGQSKTTRSEGWWKWLWSSRVPNKIKIFGWKVYKNFLPTRENLHCKRRILINGRCRRCGEGREDIFHALWICTQSKSLWRFTPYFYLDWPKSSSNLPDLLWWGQDYLGRGDFDLFFTMMWRFGALEIRWLWVGSLITAFRRKGTYYGSGFNAMWTNLTCVM